MLNDKAQLRQLYRQKRRSLSVETQHHAAHKINEQLQIFLKTSSNARSSVKSKPEIVATYLANDGEPNLALFFEHCWANNITLVLPVIHPFSKGTLFFQYFDKHTPMVQNQYGIIEPQLNCSQMVLAQNIDTVLMPLVAFDQHKRRLGMGGGFYDKTFAKIVDAKLRPNLVGIAHNVQRCESDLPAESWDIPLDNVVTPNYVI